MATQTIEFNASPGLTLTTKLFALGSDTVVASVSATGKSNDNGRYTAAFTNVPVGRYRMNAFAGSIGGFANETYRLELITATFFPDAEQVPIAPETPERDTSDTQPLEFYWPVIGATFATSASVDPTPLG